MCAACTNVLFANGHTVSFLLEICATNMVKRAMDKMGKEKKQNSRHLNWLDFYGSHLMFISHKCVQKKKQKSSELNANRFIHNLKSTKRAANKSNLFSFSPIKWYIKNVWVFSRLHFDRSSYGFQICYLYGIISTALFLWYFAQHR